MSSHSTTTTPIAPAKFEDARANVRVAFLGRVDGLSSQPSTETAARRALDLLGVGVDGASDVASPSINRQVHSTRIIAAEDAPAQADGLIERGRTARPALTVFTADCVPVLLGSAGGPIAALHAGWRGLAGGIIGKGVAEFSEPARATAWIGPAIGACCYEVNDEVALAVAQCCDASVIRPGRAARPHLDLERAARLQLEVAGVRDIRVIRCCTHCDVDWHSYRREGPGQGRNHAFIWRD